MNEQTAARAGDAAGVGTFVALTLLGERRLAGRVGPALVVRRHVREAIGPAPPKRSRWGRRKKIAKAAVLVVLLALAARGLRSAQ